MNATPILPALGLCTTWGDEGSHLRNAAKTQPVLLTLAGAAVSLLIWAASTSSGGS